MRYQDTIIESTREAMKEAFKYAKAVPADKLDWKPMDTGRSVIDMCRELAVCPTWSTMILSGQSLPEFSEESMAQFKEMTAGWTTPEICEEICEKNLEALFAAVREFPEERLQETYVLPFDGGQTITMEGNIEYPRWNFFYHQGQIAYIQTLYGDPKMYW